MRLVGVVRAGGNFNNGRNCSPVYFNCNNAPSTSNVNILARLFYRIYKKFYACLVPYRMVKIVVTTEVSKRIILPNISETIKKLVVGMKSFNVDNNLKDRELIKRAIFKVCKSKKKKRVRKYRQAQRILSQLDRYADQILKIVEATETVMKREMKGIFLDDEIWQISYKPEKCQPFTVRDGPSKKEREIISVPLFPDQIIHQLIIEAGQPVFMRGMYEYSCGSIPGRGTHKGQRYIKKVIKHHTRYDKSAIKYAAQLDVTKCYQSFSHEYLKDLLKKKFRGKLYLYMAFKVIDSYVFKTVNGKKYGLPIGYSTSQWLCNFGLTPLDHHIKEDLRVKRYVRYVDDMIFFGRNKKELHKAVSDINDYIADAGLRIKGDWQVFRFDYVDKRGNRRGRAIDTLGLRFFRDKTILRKRNALAIRRQAKKISKMQTAPVPVARSFLSRMGQLRHCNSYRFYMKNVKPYVKIKTLKRVVSNESREQYQANREVRHPAA